MKIIGLIKLLDPEAFEDYRGRVGATIAAHGGVIRNRGTKSFTAWNELDCGEFDAVVEIEFADAAQARRWAESPEYAELLPVRTRAMQLTLFGVE